MPFPEKKITRSYQPRDLRDALRASKDYARQTRNLSVERIADLIDCTADALYKWMGDGKMPACKIEPFEHACGCHFVSEYLAGGAGRIVVKVPLGRQPDAESLAGLQAVTADAVAKLARYWRGEIDYDEAHAGLTICLKAAAWHRSNMEHAAQPDLDLAAGE